MMTGRAVLKLNLGRMSQAIAAGLMVMSVPFAPGQAAAPPAAQRPIPEWQVAAGGRQEFDVISVREDKNPDDPSSVNVPYGPEDAYTSTDGIFSAKNWQVANLISFAFKNSTAQRDVFQASLPDWAMRQGFNIEARTDNHNVTKDQIRLMVQSLLADRFKLKVHYETRQVSVYVVEVVKSGALGPGLRPHPADDPCSAIVPRPTQTDGGDAPPPPPLTVAGGFPTRCGSFVNMRPSAPYLRHEGGRNITMAQIVSTFTGMGNLGRPVVDRTGLTGTYDWVMEFIDERPGHTPPADADGVTFQAALKNQVGLKLIPEKAPFEFLLVDDVKHPTEN